MGYTVTVVDNVLGATSSAFQKQLQRYFSWFRIPPLPFFSRHFGPRLVEYCGTPLVTDLEQQFHGQAKFCKKTEY
jgi:hypothetical protein